VAEQVTELVCPQCGAGMPVDEGYPVWCTGCDWNMALEPGPDGGAERRREVAGRRGTETFEELVREGAHGGGEGLTPSYVLPYAMAWWCTGCRSCCLARRSRTVSAAVTTYGPRRRVLRLGLGLWAVLTPKSRRSAGTAGSPDPVLPLRAPRREYLAAEVAATEAARELMETLPHADQVDRELCRRANESTGRTTLIRRPTCVPNSFSGGPRPRRGSSSTRGPSRPWSAN